MEAKDKVQITDSADDDEDDIMGGDAINMKIDIGGSSKHQSWSMHEVGEHSVASDMFNQMPIIKSSVVIKEISAPEDKEENEEVEVMDTQGSDVLNVSQVENEKDLWKVKI
jgi:hypothetical protein